MASIPQEIKNEAETAVKTFNTKRFSEGDTEYIANFDDEYMYLKIRRKDSFRPVARIRFTGDPQKWEFSVYDYSTDDYTHRKSFPGAEFADGTIEGALKAGVKAFYG